MVFACACVYLCVCVVVASVLISWFPFLDVCWRFSLGLMLFSLILLQQESLWIVKLVDPEGLDLLLTLLVRRPLVPSRPWMDR